MQIQSGHLIGSTGGALCGGITMNPSQISHENQPTFITQTNKNLSQTNPNICNINPSTTDSANNCS